MKKNSLKKSKRSIKDYQGIIPLKNHLRNLFFKERFGKRYDHNPKSFSLRRGVVDLSLIKYNDELLIERLKNFYILCDANFEGNKNSVWSAIFKNLHGDIHSAFIDKDNEKIIDILRNPQKYNLFYGFENMCRDLLKNKRLEDIFEPELTMDGLLSLCEAVGVITLSNPESLKIVKAIAPESAIQLLEKEFGFNLCFPNPFEGEYGIKTGKGIISYRAVQALYQAWRISIIVKNISNPAILEIGGGLGRTAYYCHQFGISDYTIVDIPISSLAQANFLGRVLPEDNLRLFGELKDTTNSKIKLIPPKEFFNNNRKYDLIINADSLTELNIEIAKQYLQKIEEVGDNFLSINHEFNSFTVNGITKGLTGLKKLYRNKYWMRRGFVEELFEKR
jgi:hypothetical protein